MTVQYLPTWMNSITLKINSQSNKHNHPEPLLPWLQSNLKYSVWLSKELLCQEVSFTLKNKLIKQAKYIVENKPIFKSKACNHTNQKSHLENLYTPPLKADEMEWISKTWWSVSFYYFWMTYFSLVNLIIEIHSHRSIKLQSVERLWDTTTWIQNNWSNEQ